MEKPRVRQFLMVDGKNVTTEIIPDHEHEGISDDDDEGCLDLFLKRFLEEGDMVVGFGTERSFANSEAQVSLLKLCTQVGCLLIKLGGVGGKNYFQLLRKMFANKDIVFAGVRIKRDLEKLEKCYGLEIRNAIDLCDVVEKTYGSRSTLNTCGVRDFIRFVWWKQFFPISMTHIDYWGSETLTEDKKIECATVDAYGIYRTAKILLKY
ncbi:hypothetical protein LWI29_008089 [Acer saccharum]|uniref:3'-5' exonuclease domain-containing protein n=1 Tax=Acer saccharum TaxID=4024 RepID=A0AA39SK56_ACESA|nr:hypothetical protein LWI29_008089 [Acer saccharum]KAK1584441.1 hypothetical protein Q3G72_033044 [Acer saccharum]